MTAAQVSGTLAGGMTDNSPDPLDVKRPFDTMKQAARRASRLMFGSPAAAVRLALPPLVALVGSSLLLRAEYARLAALFGFLCGMLPAVISMFYFAMYINGTGASRAQFPRSMRRMAGCETRDDLAARRIEERYSFAVVNGLGEVRLEESIVTAGDTLAALASAGGEGHLCRAFVTLASVEPEEVEEARVWGRALNRPERDPHGHTILGYARAVDVGRPGGGGDWMVLPPVVYDSPEEAKRRLEADRETSRIERERLQVQLDVGSRAVPLLALPEVAESARIVALVGYRGFPYQREPGAHLGLTRVTVDAEGGEMGPQGQLRRGSRMALFANPRLVPTEHDTDQWRLRPEGQKSLLACAVPVEQMAAKGEVAT